MFDRNAVWMGLLVGMALPFGGYGILLLLGEKLEDLLFPTRQLPEPLFDHITLQVLAVCLNLIPLHLYNKRRYMASMRGVMIATMLYAIAWVALSGSSLFKA